jgi:tRNA threonylcarbamoyladenosine biosynthesis protein TsaB
MMHEPLILALDTSHTRGSVAVARGDEVLSEVLFDASDTHSATLMPAVDFCLRSAKVELGGVDLFAVVSGPGSFTGLRIGAATIKGFAAVHRRPVVPVTSLEVLAAAFPFVEKPVLPLIDARRGEVYGALFRVDEGLPRELIAPFSAEPERVQDVLMGGGFTESVVVCGTGSVRYRELLEKSVSHGSIFSHARFSIPSSSLLAVLARMREQIPYEEVSGFEPLYIRPPDARLPEDSSLRGESDR